MRIHIVQKGDTLWKIAKQYGVDFEELKRVNSHLANPDYILPGMEIRIPDDSPSQTTFPNPAYTHPRGNVNPYTNQQGPMSKEQMTAPISKPTSKKEEMTKPVPKPTSKKEEMTKPVPKPAPKKEEMTKPVPKPAPKKEEMTKLAPKPAPKKEEMTKPIHKPPKEVEMKPVPIVEVTPQMPQMMPQFYFEPHIYHTQPMMPQVMPQPIFIEVPQVQQQPVEQPKEEHMPQPHIVYVPCMPHPMMMPCHHEMVPPGGPCGCKEPYLPPCPCDGMVHHGLPPQYMMPNEMTSYYGEPPYYGEQPYYGEAPHEDGYSEESVLPDWLISESSSSSRTSGKVAGEGMTKHLEDKTSSKMPYHDKCSDDHEKKSKNYRKESYPYLNPNPYHPWNY